MPVFLYKGKNKQGKVISGELDAVDQNAVGARLRDMGVVSTSIRKKPLEINLQFGTGIETKEIAIFTRQFATMINAGLPLVQCLDILGTQNENKRFKEIISQVQSSVEGGATFAESLGKHSKVFDHLFVNMVAAGESGGILDVILVRLATYIEKAEALKKKIKGALSYPAIVFSIAMIVTIILMAYVVPIFAEMFQDMGSKLPLPTQILLIISNFFKSNLLIIVGVIGASIAAYTAYKKTPKGAYNIDWLLLKLPVMGNMVRVQSVARFTRTLGTLISSGVPILDALEITAKTSGNLIVEEAIMKTRAAIKEGESISAPLKATGVFPGMVVSMIAVGESTGALDDMLTKIADFYDEEVDTAVEGLTAALEPLIMAFLGLMIGGMVIALFMPMLTMANQV